MTETPNEQRQPTTQVDKATALNYVYWLVVIGIVMYVCFANVWPYTVILEWNLDSNNEYYPKMVFMETLLAIGAPAYAIMWVIKKMMKSKEVH